MYLESPIWPRWVEINLEALRKNFQALRRLLPKQVAILPIIKSDAYGHGLVPVAKTLEKENILGFGISELEEALILRKEGIKHPLILLAGFEKEWIPEIIKYKLIPVIVDLWQLEEIAKYTREKNLTYKIHLKVDTGMNRFGLTSKDVEKVRILLEKNPHLELEGLMSHLVCSEKPEDSITQRQIEKFKYFKNIFVSWGKKIKYFHLLNSGGIIYLSNAHYNMVRPGIALYGAYPDERAVAKIELFPVMTFFSKIVSLKKLSPGEVLGYGPSFKAHKAMKIALVPVGYEDGYLRGLSNKGFAVVKGKKVPVIGTISMKCLFLDVTSIHGVQRGDKVILLGGKRREVPAETLAAQADTISYELFCRIGSKAYRIYKGEENVGDRIS